MLTTGHPLAASTKGQAAFQLPFAVNVIVYAAIVIVCLAVLGAVLLHTRRTVPDGRSLAADRRWSTQDILVVAIMSVLLEVYDNLIGDQLVTPLVQGIPYAHNLAVNDLPYMFLLMIGIAVIRKPGAATAMVFLNFLLMQLLYGGSESSPLYWPYGLLQGVFLDLYILYGRRGRVFSSAGVPAVVDGLILGALRAFPATAAQAAVITPLLSGITKTGGAIVVYVVLNTIGNSIEAGITAPLAVRIARTVRPDVGSADDDLLEPANDTSSQRPQKERER